MAIKLACLGALLAGCSARQGPQANAGDCCPPNALAPATLPVVAGPPYDLKATWDTDGGAKLRLTDLRGKPRVMAMFFANCQGVCLLTVEHMQQVQASLPADVRGKVGFVLVTLDPARDTAEKLAVYRRENVLPAGSWTILRGDDNATAELAARLGITFQRESSRGFVHSSGITLVDSDGNVIQQQLGNHPDLAAMVNALEGAINSETVAANRSAE
jgi:protein SCO1/2